MSENTRSLLTNDAPLMAEHGFINEPLYTHPPVPTAQPKLLTDEQAKQIIAKQDWGREKISNHEHCLNIIRDVEAIYGIKGN